MIGRLFRYQVQNILRSRWVFVNVGFYFVLSEIFYFSSGSAVKMEISMMNIVLIVIPLTSIVFGTMYIYGAREFFEVLAAQPVRRRDIFFSSYLIVSGALAGCFVLGAGAPFCIHGAVAADFITAALILLAGILLTMIFVGIAFAVAIGIHDRTRGIGAALMFWFYFSLLYDGLVLFAFHALSDYPIEPFALVFSFLNPVDLARIVLTLQFDVSALMGYTGAIFESFFGSWWGIALSFSAMIVWVLVPAWLALRLFLRKDF
jgi:Cu-processing system permease protein